MSILDIQREKNGIWASVNRPGASNAVNFALMERLEDLLDLLERDETVLTFILTASGRKSFVSGGDLKEFYNIRSAGEARKMARRMLSILERIERLPCWTLSCINGPAYGGGCEMMLAFDFRIAASSASFAFTQGKFYLPPGWGGLTRLVERVGRSTALGWLAEAAPIEAETALEQGLVDRLAPPGSELEEAKEWAAQLGTNDREYIKTLKEGALRYAGYRWKAIEAELEPFSHFWEDPRHFDRVERFLDGER